MAMSYLKPTHNLHSNIMHAAVKGAPEPTVGMGVTVLKYTDRSVGTITKVVSPSMFYFTEDTTEAVGEGGIGHQEWKHTPNPDGYQYAAKIGRDGRWYIAETSPTGRLTVNKYCRALAVGRRNYYHDWEF